MPRIFEILIKVSDVGEIDVTTKGAMDAGNILLAMEMVKLRTVGKMFANPGPNLGGLKARRVDGDL